MLVSGRELSNPQKKKQIHCFLRNKPVSNDNQRKTQVVADGLIDLDS
jgi:hypothetical protein